MMPFIRKGRFVMTDSVNNMHSINNTSLNKSVSFKPCIIIPVYNHHQKITQVIAQLAPMHIACIMIDDGSNNDCQQALEKIQQDNSWVTLFRLAENQGKGAAVCFALQQALQQGFTHALQVDADGQHNLADLPRFLEISQQFPQHIISGSRVYDSVPSNRRYGRLLTDVWVWINTLSFDIKDSMCGYRLYPLAQTTEVLKKYTIGQRMDFDTDIMVKHYWEGIGVKHVETAVIYDDDIISHFDLWQDNIRITLMHTRLFFGMLKRLPILLYRKFTYAQH